jgi:hypothetical protein
MHIHVCRICVHRLELRRPGMYTKYPSSRLPVQMGNLTGGKSTYIQHAQQVAHLQPGHGQTLAGRMSGKKIDHERRATAMLQRPSSFHADGSGVPGQVLTRHLYAWCLRTRVQQYIQHPWYTTVSFSRYHTVVWNQGVQQRCQFHGFENSPAEDCVVLVTV